MKPPTLGLQPREGRDGHGTGERSNSVRESLGVSRSRALWFVAFAMMLLGAGTAVSALLGWSQVTMAGIATLLTGVAALLLLLFRRVGVVLRTLREHDGRFVGYQEEVERRTRAAQGATQSLDALHADLLGPDGRLISFERRLLAEIGSLDDVVSGMSETVAAQSTQIRTASDRSTKRIQQRSDVIFRQAEAMFSLYRQLSPRLPLPYSRGWAASPDLLRTVVESVLEERPSLVVECGSGLSTIWIGYALQAVGSGRCVSLEHDSDYARETTRELDRHGLTEVAEVRHAPLKVAKMEGVSQPWYDTTSVEDLDGISMLLVDGPPKATGPRARYPALPLLRSRMRSGSLVILDDTARDDERDISDAWMSSELGIVRQVLPHEKGCDVLRLP